MYAQSKKASKCTKQKLIKWQGETDKPTITARDFNTPPEVQQGLRKLGDREDLNKTINQPDLVHTVGRMNILSKCIQNIYQDRPHTDHKTSPNKFKRIQILYFL